MIANHLDALLGCSAKLIVVGNLGYNPFISPPKRG